MYLDTFVFLHCWSLLSLRLYLQLSQLSLLLVTPCSWQRSLQGVFLAPFHWLSSLCIPWARSFLSEYITIWCNFSYAVVAHVCCLVYCGQLSQLVLSLERQKVSFMVPFPGYFMKIQWGAEDKEAAAVCWYLSLWCGWILLERWVCPGMLNVMSGDPWCHPALAAEVVRAFMCLFGFKEQYLSSDRKLGHLCCLSSPLPLVSLGLASFFP